MQRDRQGVVPCRAGDHGGGVGGGTRQESLRMAEGLEQDSGHAYFGTLQCYKSALHASVSAWLEAPSERETA